METRRGLTRTVFLIGRWAIKVPRASSNRDGVRGVLWAVTRGIQANLSEANWSNWGPGVCPVRWSLAGLINVYPRCEPVGPDEEVDYESLNFPTASDRKPENVGWLNGELVWIDYDMSWNDCHCGRVPTMESD